MFAYSKHEKGEYRDEERIVDIDIEYFTEWAIIELSIKVVS